jgi:hypothetical protein
VRPSRSPLNQIIGATILLIGAGLVFFPAYVYWNGSVQHSVTPLPKWGALPHFEAVDQADRSVGTAELSGTIWVAGLVDAEKPQVAELLCSKFAELDQSLQGAKGLALVSFFLGAEKNGVEDYARRYEASDRWRLVSVVEDNAPSFTRDLSSAIAHCRPEVPAGNVFVLIDRQGEIRGVYDASASEVVQKILLDVGNLLRSN